MKMNQSKEEPFFSQSVCSVCSVFVRKVARCGVPSTFSSKGSEFIRDKCIKHGLGLFFNNKLKTLYSTEPKGKQHS